MDKYPIMIIGTPVNYSVSKEVLDWIYSVKGFQRVKRVSYLIKLIKEKQRGDTHVRLFTEQY